MHSAGSVRLSDVADIRSSNVDKLSVEGELDVQLCNYMDVYSNERITSSIDFMRATATPVECARFRVERGDVLMTKDSETPDDIGVPAVVTEDIPGLVCGYHLALLKPDAAKVDPGYLSKWIGSTEAAAYFARVATGSTRFGLTYSAIANTPVRLPPLVQQRRAAEVLFLLDEAIEHTESMIAKTQQITAGLMHDLFTRGVTADGQLRPPREDAPELYKESALGWIPVEWEASGLASRGRSGAQWIRTGPFGSALKGEHWRKHGHAVITIGALGEGEFIASELLFVDATDAARLVDFQLKAGDVVFSRVADVGRSVVVRDEQCGWIMSSNLMRIAVDVEKIRPDFLQMALAGDLRVKTQIRAQVNSGGRDVANSNVLGRLVFTWPDPDEQDRIIDRLGQVSEFLRSEGKKCQKLRAQKLGLMNDLLSGRSALSVSEATVI